MKAERPLRSALVAALLWPLLALLALDTVIGSWTSSVLADQAYDRGLHEIAREAALHVRDSPQGPRLELSDQAQQALLVDQDDQLALRVWAADGQPLGGDPELVRPPQAPPRDGKPLFYSTRLRGEAVRVAVSWQPYSEDRSQRVMVQVAETLHKRQRLAWEIVGSLIGAQLVLIAMACAAVYLGIGRGLRPLQLLGRALAQRSHQDLSPLEADRAPPEVRPLVEEVNGLMLRLGATLEAQNRFVADAAHQLKTPVAGLKAQIEVALEESDPERVRHSLAQLYLSAERLSRIVQQLLALARNEPAAAAAVRLQSLDLEAFALELCMEWVPHALRRSIDLGFEGEQRRLPIDADPDRLRDLVNNLVDNAVRYSRDGGRVTVKVGTDGQERFLSISDDGPTIPEQERSRVFERFHRLLGGGTDGSGLGLAIVHEIASLHGARITLREDTDGIGNTFIVHFPCPPADPPA